jgi:hypothetical protein
MKQTILILLMAVILSSCGNSDQSKAVDQAKDIQSAIKPGTVATTADGYMMKAKIDGKEWVATSMMPPDAAGRIVGYYDNQYMGFPYSKSDMTAGKKIMFGEDNAVDLSLNNGCLWKDIKGEMEITKADDNSAEGKFSFTTTCSSSGKTVEVTDGLFRILLSGK